MSLRINTESKKKRKRKTRFFFNTVKVLFWQQISLFWPLFSSDTCQYRESLQYLRKKFCHNTRRWKGSQFFWLVLSLLFCCFFFYFYWSSINSQPWLSPRFTTLHIRTNNVHTGIKLSPFIPHHFFCSFLFISRRTHALFLILHFTVSNISHTLIWCIFSLSLYHTHSWNLSSSYKFWNLFRFHMHARTVSFKCHLSFSVIEFLLLIQQSVCVSNLYFY